MTRARVPVALAVLMTVAGLGATLYPRGSTPVALAGDVLPARAAPTFELKDQFDASIRLNQFRGHPVVLTFMQSHCTGLCPLVTETVRRALEEVGQPGDQVAVLAISDDPEGDTRSSVVRFSRQHGMLHRWHYLTGTRSQLRSVWERYYIYVAPPDAPARLKNSHTSAVYLIDGRGRERVLMLGDPDTLQLVHNLRVLLGIPLLSGNNSAVPAPQVGHPAPGFVVRTLRNGWISLPGLRRPILLNFWATWCTACAQEVSTLRRIYEGRGKHLVVLGIDEQEPTDAVARYANTMRLKFPIAVDEDGNIGARYDVAGLPMSILVNAQGRVTMVRYGPLSPSDPLSAQR